MVSKAAMAHFFDSLDEPPSPVLEHVLDSVWETASSALPDIPLAAADFFRHLARHTAQAEDPAGTLQAIPAEDLFLACACAMSIDRSIETFEQKYGAYIEAVVRSFRLPQDLTQEVHLQVRSDLFVGKTEPEIGKYAARGALSVWLKAVVSRTALRMKKKERAVHSLERRAGEEFFAETEGDQGAVVELFKKTHGTTFESVLRQAIQSLPRLVRVQMKLYYAEQMHMEDIAKIYNTHRTTVTRNLQRGRKIIQQQTSVLLAKQHEFSQNVAASMMQKAQEYVNVTIRTLLSTMKVDSEED